MEEQQQANINGDGDANPRSTPKQIPPQIQMRIQFNLRLCERLVIKLNEVRKLSSFSHADDGGGMNRFMGEIRELLDAIDKVSPLFRKLSVLNLVARLVEIANLWNDHVKACTD